MKFPKRKQRRSHKRRNLAIWTAAAAFETAALWMRTGRVGGSTIVRCREGHLFTTIWIPAASAKSVRLGFWRVQFCPVGRHWALVTPVRPADLSRRERRAAAQQHDVRIP